MCTFVRFHAFLIVFCSSLESNKCYEHCANSSFCIVNSKLFVCSFFLFVVVAQFKFSYCKLCFVWNKLALKKIIK